MPPPAFLRRAMRRRALFAVVALLLFFSFAELASRAGLFVYSRAKYGDRLAAFAEADLISDEQTGWKWRGPQLFRGREDVAPGPHPGLFRIIATGDSCVWGALVSPEATFTDKLDVLLKKRYGPERVGALNAGVVGYSTRQVAAHVRENLADYQPDLILYYGTGADSSLWLRGARRSRAPWLDRYTPYLFVSKFFLVLGHGMRALHPPPKPDTWLVKNDDITELQNTCTAIGARLMLIEYLIVERGRITSDLDGIGEKLDLPLVRTLATFRDVARPTRALIFDHEHPTPLGHTLIADRLLDTVVSQGWITP
jgi:hypothetical protein